MVSCIQHGEVVILQHTGCIFTPMFSTIRVGLPARHLTASMCQPHYQALNKKIIH